uniref:Cytochrome c oxidase subunit 3 n=1 Tax=Hiatella arctica TaxID=120431 RepID=Q06SB4_9BIVA|nr:cytochrome c oxidase subunit 3 [Hiatella arctica]
MLLQVLFKLLASGFHVLGLSLWPFSTSISALGLVYTFLSWINEVDSVAFYVLLSSIVLMVASLTLWWSDVIKEGLYLGCHTSVVVRGFRLGMFFFLLSEGSFFFSFFGAFFFFKIGTNSEGMPWPPEGIFVVDYAGIPLLNTVLLVSSGVTVTVGLKAAKHYNRISTLWGLKYSIFLGVIFSCLQLEEYKECYFTMMDGVYGSLFFMMTGFHGLHVCIGTIFLTIMLFRCYFGHFEKPFNYFGLEAAVWYWHFVDIIWILLYLLVYCWGSLEYFN